MKRRLNAENRTYDHILLSAASTPMLGRACWVVASDSPLWLLAYLPVVGACLATEMYFFCSRCPYYGKPYCRMEEMIPARLRLGPVKWFRAKPGPLRLRDKALIIGFDIVIGSFPFYWFWQHPKLLILYFVFVAFFFVVILTFSCSRCAHFSCPFNRVSEKTRAEFEQYLRKSGRCGVYPDKPDKGA